MRDKGLISGGSKGGVQILSISCNFWENLAKSYVGAPLGSWHPLLGEILDPPLLIHFVNRNSASCRNFSKT